MLNKRESNLKSKLDNWYDKICVKSFIEKDPVQFPWRYSKREDIETAAFLAATIAWGRRDLILRSANKMFTIMGKSPYEYRKRFYHNPVNFRFRKRIFLFVQSV